LLHLSVRQVKRLKAKVRNGGATAILHGDRGRKPHNAIPESREKKIIDFAEGKLKGYNFTHMKEVIEEESGITISYSSFRRILKRHGIKSPKGVRRRKSIVRGKQRRIWESWYNWMQADTTGLVMEVMPIFTEP
jgi:transposase